MPANTDLVRSLYDAFSEGDIAAFLARLDPQVRWNEAEGHPLADRNPYIGPAAIVSGVFERLLGAWDDFRVEPTEIVGSGDVVVALCRYKARNKATGKKLDVQASHTWWIAGGKIVRFQQMVDTAGMARAMA
jgi:uncharacterized protein